MRTWITVACCCLIAAAACGPKTTSLTPSPSRDVLKKTPDWFLEPPAAADHLYAVATMTSRDMQVCLQKAKSAAQMDLAQQMETKLANLTKQFQEEVGVDEDSELLQQFSSATKVVTDQTLNGARLDRQEILPERGIYRAYVLMSLPIGAANQLLLDKLKANQSLYTRFRATQAFDDLNKELEAYRERSE